MCLEWHPPLKASGRWILTDNRRYCPIIARSKRARRAPPDGAMTLSKPQRASKEKQRG